jgi:hypothetical protein
LEEINIISTVLKAYLKAEMGRKRRQLSKIFGFKEGNAPSLYCRIPKNTHQRRNIMFVCVIVRIRDC